MIVVTVQEVTELPRDLLNNFSRIKAVLDKVRGLEKKFDEAPSRSEQAMRELVDWAIRQGCFVRGIQVRCLKGSDECGVFCTDALQVRI